MGHLYLQCCCGIVEGIAVDVHVHRISNRLKWTSSKTPEETMKQLQEWLPKELYMDINFVLVGFGQTICEAKKPKCGQCLITDSCPFFRGEVKDNKKPKSKSRSKSVSKSKSFSVKKNQTKSIFISDEDSEINNNSEEERFIPKKDRKSVIVGQKNNDDIIKSKGKSDNTIKKNKKVKENNENSYFENLETFKDDEFLNDSTFLKVKNANKSNSSNKIPRKFQSKKELDHKKILGVDSDKEDEINATDEIRNLRSKAKDKKHRVRNLLDSDHEESRMNLLKDRRRKK